jgi:hypothetical protein
LWAIHRGLRDAASECSKLGATLSRERYGFGFEIDSASADVRAGVVVDWINGLVPELAR